MQKFINIFLYLLLLALVFCGALFFRQSFFVVLLLLLVALPFASYFAARFAFRRLTVRFFAGAHPVARLCVSPGATLPITFQLENKGFFPLLHCELLYRFHALYYQEGDIRGLVLPAVARQTSAHAIPVTMERSGCFRATLLSVAARDYLGFFSFQKKLDLRTEVMVIPEAAEDVSYHDAYHQEGFDEYEESSQKGSISSNVTDIREYQPGDRLQKIHWKVSAKINKLMVKENETPSQSRFFILVELYLPSYESDFLDTALDYAYVLAEELLSARENFALGCYSVMREDFLSFPVVSAYDLTQAMESIYYEKTYDTEGLGLDMYQRAGLGHGTILQVTHEGVENVECKV